jgi:hypothetical protein
VLVFLQLVSTQINSSRKIRFGSHGFLRNVFQDKVINRQ